MLRKGDVDIHIALEMAPEHAGSIVQFKVLSADDRSINKNRIEGCLVLSGLLVAAIDLLHKVPSR
jgi:hypothetical protein